MPPMTSILYTKPTDRGHGTFTSVPIAPTTHILTFEGPIKHRSEMTDYEMWIQISKDHWMGSSGGSDDYVNHSCDPNTGLFENETGLHLIALRHIAANEEITFDYSTSMFEEPTEMRCICGATACRGVIRNFIDLPISVQEKYLLADVVPRHAYS